MTARPTELKLVAELLEQPADDVDQLARDVINALDHARAARPVWTVVIQAGGTVWGKGIWPTEAAARRAVQSGRVAVMTGARAMVVKIQGATEDP